LGEGSSDKVADFELAIGEIAEAEAVAVLNFQVIAIEKIVVWF
jgi:hypothetical protein